LAEKCESPATRELLDQVLMVTDEPEGVQVPAGPASELQEVLDAIMRQYTPEHEPTHLLAAFQQLLWRHSSNMTHYVRDTMVPRLEGVLCVLELIFGGAVAVCLGNNGNAVSCASECAGAIPPVLHGPRHGDTGDPAPPDSSLAAALPSPPPAAAHAAREQRVPDWTVVLVDSGVALVRGEMTRSTDYEPGHPGKDPARQVLLGMPPDPVWPRCYGANRVCFAFSAVWYQDDPTEMSTPRRFDLSIGLAARGADEVYPLYTRANLDLDCLDHLLEVGVVWCKLAPALQSWAEEVRRVDPVLRLRDCMRVSPHLTSVDWLDGAGQPRRQTALRSVKYLIQGAEEAVVKKTVLVPSPESGSADTGAGHSSIVDEARSLIAGAGGVESPELLHTTVQTLELRNHVQALHDRIGTGAAAALEARGLPVQHLRDCRVTCERGYADLGADELAAPVLRMYLAPIGRPLDGDARLRSGDEVLAGLRDVLEQVAVLHDHARVVHRDVRWGNVVRCPAVGSGGSAGGVRYMLIDMECSVFLNTQRRAVTPEAHPERFDVPHVRAVLEAGDYGTELDLGCVGHLLCDDKWTVDHVRGTALEELPAWVVVFGSVLRDLPASAAVVREDGGTGRVVRKFCELMERASASAESSVDAGLRGELEAAWGFPRSTCTGISAVQEAVGAGEHQGSQLEGRERKRSYSAHGAGDDGGPGGSEPDAGRKRVRRSEACSAGGDATSRPRNSGVSSAAGSSSSSGGAGGSVKRKRARGGGEEGEGKLRSALTTDDEEDEDGESAREGNQRRRRQRRAD